MVDQTEDIEHRYNCNYLNSTEPDAHFKISENVIEREKFL
jgi:hypothetical protein